MPHDIVEQDARWLRRTGQRRRVSAGEEVVRADGPPEHLLVVLDGELEMVPAGGDPPRRLGPGSLLGDTPELRRPAPEGPVRAATDAVLLCLRPADVDARIREDPPFRDRFLGMLTDLSLDEVSGGSEGVPQMIERLLKGI